MSTEKSLVSLHCSSPSEQTYLDFYQKLRKRLRGRRPNTGVPGKAAGAGAYRILVESLALLPDLFHLSGKLLFDRRVPAENKGALIAVLIYVMSPLDFIPDGLPVAGWVDDLVVMAVGLHKFLETAKPDVRQAVARHWAGTYDVLDSVKHVLNVADEAVEFLPKKLLGMMKSIFRP